ncbi:MAG: hypothetical protein KDI17_14715 [Halioglobus sp.]|nr:hypothetical protein [Halioglobus sp.]
MLDEQSYLTAIYIYVGAAVVMLLYLAWWLSRHWRPVWVSLVVLVLAALLLTPAYPKAGVATMAPALIVAAFQIATEGLDSARHALRPLVFMSGIGVVIALFLNMTLFRRRNARKAKAKKVAAKA